MAERERAVVCRAFVLCPSYHGATLLGTLLGRNPNVVHLGDTNPPRRDGVACSCGLPIGTCPFWQGLRSTLGLDAYDHLPKKWMPRFPAFTGRNGVDRVLTVGFAAVNRVAGRPLDSAVSGAAQDYRRVSDGLAEYAMSSTGARLFVDGEKSLTKALFLTTSDPSTARVIHLVRDPRGFAWSSLSRGRSDPGTLARDWRRGHSGIRLALRLLGTKSVLTVRYEDLAQHPGASAEQIFRFLGVDQPEAFCGDEEQHLIGNRMLIDFDGAIRLDEKWREGLGEADAARVLAEAGRFASRMGYGLGEGRTDSGELQI